MSVRGCEVEGMLDATGRVIQDRPDEQPEIPKGDNRTFRVWLDENQFQTDMVRAGKLLLEEAVCGLSGFVCVLCVLCIPRRGCCSCGARGLAPCCVWCSVPESEPSLHGGKGGGTTGSGMAIPCPRDRAD